MAGPNEQLIRIELGFRTEEDPGAIADRIRESVVNIVGRETLEDFRVRTVPLGEKPKGLRSVD
ncbi:MAG: hypothetical protein QOE83_2333 [Actinomycetota bacterium]|jgi:hypothetical protein|nr:hypothetical protein [Actinomycetota bacterium]